LGGGGPMGLGMIDYFLHADLKPGLLVVTEMDEKRIKRAQQIFSSSRSKQSGGPKLVFLNPGKEDLLAQANKLTDNKLFDDIFTLFPAPNIIEQADQLLAEDGCHDFFAGPPSKPLRVTVDFYEIHYSSHKHIGSSGGNTEDLKEALKLLEEDRLNPAQMVSAVGGLDSIVETIPKLPSLPGGKKLIYTGIKMPLVELSELEALSKKESTPPLYRKVYADLAHILAQNQDLWSKEAEDYILSRKELSWRLS